MNPAEQIVIFVTPFAASVDTTPGGSVDVLTTDNGLDALTADDGTTYLTGD